MNIRLLIVILITFFLLSNKVVYNNSRAIILTTFQENDDILWSKQSKLKWEDFRGAREFGKANAVASTQCEIKILNVSLLKGLPNIKIGTFFIKEKSWTITNEIWALEHEQAHFDINEIYSRKIRKEFKRLNFEKEKDIKVYQNIFYILIKESEFRNEEFDKEVYFNLEKQNAWISNITKELEDLSQYELSE